MCQDHLVVSLNVEREREKTRINELYLSAEQPGGVVYIKVNE